MSPNNNITMQIVWGPFSRVHIITTQNTGDNVWLHRTSIIIMLRC